MTQLRWCNVSLHHSFPMCTKEYLSFAQFTWSSSMRLTRNTIKLFYLGESTSSGQHPLGQGVHLGQLHQLGILGLKGAVGSCGSAVVIAAEPVTFRGNRTASLGTCSLLVAALIFLGQKLGTPASTLSLRQAVTNIDSWSTLDQRPTARTTHPVGFRAASPRTIKLTRIALF